MAVLFERAHITATNSDTTEATGPFPWRRLHRRDTGATVFHMVIPRPLRLWDYQGRHRAPRHAAWTGCCPASSPSPTARRSTWPRAARAVTASGCRWRASAPWLMAATRDATPAPSGAAAS